MWRATDSVCEGVCNVGSIPQLADALRTNVWIGHLVQQVTQLVDVVAGEILHQEADLYVEMEEMRRELQRAGAPEVQQPALWHEKDAMRHR